MIPLREQLIRFVTELRAAGIRVSVAESIDAVNAVAAVGLERIRMREALAAALIKDEADRVAFDEVFGRIAARRNRRPAAKAGRARLRRQAKRHQLRRRKHLLRQDLRLKREAAKIASAARRVHANP
jgi:uncharacterized protein with von Willebrand factor type A (vWA) domain